jgi:hypothetical protein
MWHVFGKISGHLRNECSGHSALKMITTAGCSFVDAFGSSATGNSLPLKHCKQMGGRRAGTLSQHQFGLRAEGSYRAE